MPGDEDLILTITDIRRVYCVAGAKEWFESYGLDFRHFLQNGIPASDMLGRGDDGLIQRIIDAKKEFEHGQE